MAGVSATTGKTLAGRDHLAQSIGDILSTPIGTRVMRRDYGSVLPDLIDRPINDETVVDIFAGIAEALDRWEPRFRLARVVTVQAQAGRLIVDLEGDYLPAGDTVMLEGIVIQ